MLPLWLREFRRRLDRAPARKPRPRARLRPEELEDRVTPATITWTSPTDGNWATAANWDLGRVPAAGDDVVIPDLGAAGANITVTLNSGTPTVQSVTSAENLTLSGAATVLTLSGGTRSVSVAGAFSLGGTLKGAAVAAGTTATAAGGTLDGVTVAAGATVALPRVTGLTVRNGLTVDGTVDFRGDTTTLRFDGGDQLLGGSGVVKATGTGGNVPAVLVGQSAATLTVGAGLTVQVATGGGLVVGAPSGVTGAAVRNLGTVRADAGTLTVGTGGAAFTNAAGGVARAAGGTLAVAGAWTNAGTFDLQAGTFDFGGTFARAAIGTFTRSGGTARLSGVLDNSGGTLDLAAAGGLGAVTLAGGTVRGGTVAGTAATPVTAAGTAGTLDGTALGAGAVLTLPRVTGVRVVNGLTVDGLIDLAGDTTTLTFAGGSQAVGGSGTIRASETGGNVPAVLVQPTGATLTVGAGLTVAAAAGGDLIVRADTGAGGVTVLNRGTLRADAGRALTIGNTSTAFTNAAGGAVRAAGTVSVNAASWSNAGTFQVDAAGVLNLGGAFTQADVGTLTRAAGSTVNLTGTLTGGLTLSDDTGSWGLSGGTLAGGTYAVAAGSAAALLPSQSGGTFDGVTIDAPLDLAPINGATVSLRGNIVLNSTITVGGTGASQNAGRVTAAADTSVTTTAPAGVGQIVFGQASGNALEVATGRTLTLGPGVTVRGQTVTFAPGSGGRVVNRGTIRRDVAGGRFWLDVGLNGRNEGVIDTTAAGETTVTAGVQGGLTNAPGATISAAAGTLIVGFQGVEAWVNQGTLSVSTPAGATPTVLAFGGTVTQASLGAVVRDAGSVVRLGTGLFAGTLSGGLTLSDATGPYVLAGMTLSGGTYAVAPGSAAALVMTSTGGTLDGVAINAPLDLTQVNGARVELRGAIVLNSTIAVGHPTDAARAGTVSFPADATLTTTAPAGVAQIVLGAAAGNAVAQSLANVVLTIGPGVTVRGRSGTIGTVGRVVNRGTIRRDVAGGAFAVALGNAGRNEGTIDATAAGTTTVGSGGAFLSWTNEPGATVSASAGTLNVGTALNETWTNLGTLAVATPAGAAPTALVLGGGLTRDWVGTLSRDARSVVRLGRSGVRVLFQPGLALRDTDGEWELDQGEIGYGTVSAAGASRLVVASASANFVLRGVTLTTPIDLTRIDGGRVNFADGLVLDTVQPVGSADGTRSGAVRFVAGEMPITTTTGGGFALGPNDRNELYQLSTAGTALSFGPGVSVRGRGAVTAERGNLINYGTFEATGGGNGLRVAALAGGRVTNLGTFRAAPGGDLRIAGTGWLNGPTGRVEAAGGAFTVSALAWSNQGTIAATDANLGPLQSYAPVINVGGTFTQADLGTFTRTPRTTVNLTGTLAGGLTLDDTTGSWNLAGGTLQGGTFAVAPGSAATLAVTGAGSTLAGGVTLNAPIDLNRAGSGVRLDVTGGLTLNTTLTVGSAAGVAQYSQVRFPGTQTIRTDGGGRIVFGASSFSNGLVQSGTGGGVLTIGRGVTVEGPTGQIGNPATTPFTVVNEGTILAAGAPPALIGLQVLSDLFDNRGTVRATDGGRLVLAPDDSLVNLSGPAVPTTGTGPSTRRAVPATLSGGTWVADAGGRIVFDPTTPLGTGAAIQVTRSAAAVVIDGAGSGIVNAALAGPVYDDVFASLVENQGAGSLTVRGQDLAVPTEFVNRGELTVAAGSALAVDQALPPPDGLLGWWRADDDAADAGPAGINLTARNVTYTAGRFGQAWSFPSPGNADLTAAANAPNPSGAGLTVEAWVTPNFSALSGTRPLVDKYTPGATTATNAGYALALVNGRPTLTLATANNRSFTLTAPNPLGSGQTRHVAATYDGATARLYVDRTLVASAALTGAVTSDGRALRLGNDNSVASPTGGFIGLLDNVAVYDRARTPAELQATARPFVFRQLGGTLTVDGTLAPVAGTLVVEGGTLRGTGTIQGGVENRGTVAPGSSPGFLRVIGDYTQTAAGLLDLEIAGRNPNTPDYDRLQVTGTATLDGTVRETLLGGFGPAPGDTFNVLTAAAVSLAPTLAYQLPSPGGALRELAPFSEPGKLSFVAQRVPPITFRAGTTASGNGTLNETFTPWDVEIDADGNSYVVGDFSLTVDFDREHDLPGDTLTSSVLSRGFLAKYGPDGVLLWVRAINEPGSGAFGVALDGRGTLTTADDRVYVVGDVGSTLSYPGLGSTPLAAQSAFILRTNSAGDGQAIVALESSGATSPYAQLLDVAVSPVTGNPVVTGWFREGVDLDPGPGSLVATSLSVEAALVAEYTPGLTPVRFGVLEGDQAVGTGGDEFRGSEVAVDAAGDVWVVGDFNHSLSAGLAALTNAAPFGFSADVFLLKLRGAGAGFNTLVARSYGGISEERSDGLAVDPSGAVVIGMDSDSPTVDLDPAPDRAFTLVNAGQIDGLLLKVDANGDFLWGRGVGGFRNDGIGDVAVDAGGNVYAAGNFSDTVDFDPLDGTYYLTASTAGVQGYVLRLDSNGRFNWAAQLGGPATGFLSPYTVAVGRAGQVASVGQFWGTVDLDPTGGLAERSYAQPGFGSRAGFVTLLTQKAAPAAAIAGLPAAAVPQGTTLSAAAVVTDPDSTYFTYAWAVQRGTDAPLVGTGPVFGTVLTNPGAYSVTLVVTDESGNTATDSRSVLVTNAAPQLNPTAYAAPVALAAGANPPANGAIGSSLASGNGYTLAGAPSAPVAGLASGAVRVYDAAGGQVRTLAPPAPAAGMQFGAAVAVVGDYAVVGAPGVGGGAVFVFRLSDGGFVRSFAGPVPVAGDRFGASLAAFGRFAVVGAPRRKTAAGEEVGEAYLFDPAAGRLVATYANPAATPGDRFGAAIAAAGGLVLVGAPGNDAAAADAGAVFVFDPATGRPTRTLLNPNPTPIATPTGAVGSGFGSALAAAGLRAAVGAPAEAVGGTLGGGATYVFDLDPASFTFGRMVLGLKNPAGGAGAFGSSVAGAGDRLVVGAPADAGGGAAVVFDLDPGSLTYGTAVATVKKGGGAAGDQLGAAVAFGGRDVLAGAPGDDALAADSGRVYRAAAGAYAAFSDASLDENGVLSVSGSFADPGTADGHTVVIDWGNGAYTRTRLAAGTNVFSATYQYLDDDPTGTAQDTYTVRVRVEDDYPDLLVVGTNPGDGDVVSRYDGTVGAPLGTTVPSGQGGPNTNDITSAAVGPDGLLYVSYTGDLDRLVRFDPATGERVGVFIPGFAVAPGAGRFAFGPDGVLYALTVGQESPLVRRYGAATGAVLPPGEAGTVYTSLPAPFAPDSFTGLPYSPRSFAVGPNGNLFVANLAGTFVGGNATVFNVVEYDRATGAYVRTVVTVRRSFGEPAPGAGAGAPVYLPYGPDQMGFAADGTLYVLGTNLLGQGRTLFQYDPATGDLLRRVVLADEATAIGAGDGFLLRPDGTVLWSNPDPAARTVSRFDLATGEALGTFVPAAAGRATGGFLVPLGPQDVTAPTRTVRNVAPTVSVRAAANPAGAPAGAFTLTADVADPGTRDTRTYAWTVTAGGVTYSAGATTPTFTYVPAAGTPPAPLTINLTVTDDDTGSAAAVVRVIFGTAGNDTITLSDTQSKIGAAAAVNYGAGVTKIVVYGLAGNDTISAASMTAAGGIPVELVGGNGADTLSGGPKADVLLGNSPGDYAAGTDDRAADSLSGGAGNDTLDGGLGNDTVAGGDDDDRYLTRPGSDDLLTEEGSTGVDTIDYSIASFGITFALEKRGVRQVVNPSAPLASQHTVEARGVFENLDGSPFGDDLSGDDGDNAIDGGAGDDKVFGGPKLTATAGLTGGGTDTLAGGPGNDSVVGGAGNDAIFGGYKPSLVAYAGPLPGTPGGAPDDDTLEGGLGDDDIDGGAGNDAIWGGYKTGGGTGGSTERNTLAGGPGNDSITGGAGNDAIFGGYKAASGAAGLPVAGADDDQIEGGLGDDRVDGGAGNDAIWGGYKTGGGVPPGATDNNTLSGGKGNDSVYGGAGNDAIFGGSRGDDFAALADGTGDDDYLEGGAGDDEVDGGAGDDQIFGGTKAQAGAARDTLVGGPGNDSVAGGAGNDAVYGGPKLAALYVGADDDVLEGGGGSDRVDGGAGNDAIFGGYKTGGGGLPTDRPTLVGGGGNDSIVGGPGNDAIWGGEQVAPVGAAAADVTLGGVKLAAVRLAAADDDQIEGGWGNDSVDGGAGNDAIWGGYKTGGTPPAGAGDDDSLRGGRGNDSLSGGAGNDAIFGEDGDDRLSGGMGTDALDGGSENDLLAESADADLILTATGVVVGGLFEPFFDVEAVALAGGAGDNLLDATGGGVGLPFAGPVSLSGGAGNDTLKGTAFGDTLLGGAGNDSLVGGAGADVLDTGGGTDTADGGDDNDLYLLALTGPVVIDDSQGIDGVDLSASAFAVRADLEAGTIVDTAGNTVALPPGAIENLTGTSLADAVKGSAGRNILAGGGGADAVDGGEDADTLRGGFLQLVYLDFDSATGPGEHAYTIEERNLIQARLQAAYPAPFTVTFTQAPPATGRYATVVINAGEADDTEALVAGVAAEVDGRNVNPAAGALINVNGFLGRPGQPPATSANYVALTANVTAHEVAHLFGLRHSDAWGPIGINPATGLPYGVNPGVYEAATAREVVAGAAPVGNAVEYILAHGLVRLAATAGAFVAPQGVVSDGATAVATFTVAANGTVALTPIGTPARRVLSATLDAAEGVLKFTWTAAPPASSVDALYQYSPVRPEYPGPATASETARHVMASPASLGTSIDDVLGTTYFGERELIKLALADAGAARHEAAVPAAAIPGGLPAGVAARLSPGGQVRTLGALPELAVPNLLPAGTVNFGKRLAVRAVAVVGRVELNSATGKTEGDLYAFEGRAGELLTAELFSATLRQRIPDWVDGVIRVYGPSGALVAYYAGRAESDDGVDNQDPVLQDVRLPADGTYYVEVDTYTGPGVPDTAAGGYELVLYTYANPAAGGPAALGGGDTLAGGDGFDTVTGSAAGDFYVDATAADTLLGRTEVDQTVPTLNRRPTVAVRITPDVIAPSDDAITLVQAFATPADPEGDSVALAYAWSVNGRSVPAAGNTLGQILLPGQVVSVTVTPSDAFGPGEPATASAVVSAGPPVAAPQSITVREDTPALHPLALTDAGGNPVAPALTAPPARGTLRFDRTGLGFVFTPAADFSGADSFQYVAVSRTGAGNPAVVTVTVTPVNDAPTFAGGGDVTVAEDAGPQSVAGWATGMTAGPANEAGQVLTFEVTTDRPGLFLVAPAVDPATGRLTFTPAANAWGTAAVTVRLRDSGGTADGGVDVSAARTFALTVTPVNDAPTVPSGSFNAYEDITFTGQIAGADVDDAVLTYRVVTPPARGRVTLDAATGAFTYTPNAGLSGADSFTFVASDGRLDSNVGTATINVNGVNDAPSFTAGANVTVLEDAAPYSAVWATGISAGPGDPLQALTFEVTADRPDLFAVAPAVDPATGKLSFTPAAGANGVATLTVVLRDNGGTADGGVDASAPRTFTVTITAVNDAPTFTPGADQEVAADAGLQSRPGWATGIAAGPPDESGQLLSFEVTTDRPDLFTALPAVNAVGTLTFTPNPAAADGTATVTVTLKDDGGTANGGANASPPRTFTIRVVGVAPANTAPVLSGANPFTGITEDDTANLGSTAAELLAGKVADANAGQAVGVAVVAAAVTGAGGGKWQYRRDGATGWTDLGTPTATAARLLAPADRLRFLPDGRNGNAGSLTVRAWDGFTGAAGGTADASANGGQTAFSAATAAATIAVAAVNDSPAAGPDVAATAAGQPVGMAAPGVLGNDTDPDAGDTLTVSAVNGSAAGVGADVTTAAGAAVRMNADGSFVYSPGAAFVGLAAGATATDSFTYTASDGHGGTATGTVTVTITGANDAPAATVALSSPSPKTFDTLTATATTSDPDGDPVKLTFVWRVNGVVVREVPNTTALTDSLDLAAAGNGDAGDVVTVEVTPNDEAIGGPTVSATATVVDSPPAAPAVTGVSDDTGADPADGVTRDNTLVVSGTGTPGTAVTVYRDGAAVGTAAVAAGGGWVFDGTGTALADGPYTFTAAASYPKGALGPASAGFAVAVDTAGPTVRTFEMLDPSPTDAAAVHYRLTFSEPVSGLAAANFALTTAGVSGAAVTDVAGGGTTWTVTVGTGSGDGTLALRLADGAGATDAAGNPATPTDGPAYTLNRAAPKVVKFEVVYGPRGAYDLAPAAARRNLPWRVTAVRVTFSEPVTGTADSLGVTGRSGPLAVARVAGSGTDTLTWTLAAPVELDLVTAALARAGGAAVKGLSGAVVSPAKAAFAAAVVYGDVNGDKKVDGGDQAAAAAILKAGKADPRFPFADLNGDGDVGAADLAILKTRLGTQLP